MNYELAILDDDEGQLKLMSKRIASFNKKSQDNIQAKFYDCPDDLLSDFCGDFVAVDIDLGLEDINGLDVAKQLLERGKVVVAVSALIDEHEDSSSLICKRVLKISELMERFKRLKKRPNRNILELLMRRATLAI